MLRGVQEFALARNRTILKPLTPLTYSYVFELPYLPKYPKLPSWAGRALGS